ncbi:MAG: hypothetical protein MUF00_04905 [Gemmatimonadaceae bacterium]|nr:hypothetical protein [Gemmatimonadaceae bacterium]
MLYAHAATAQRVERMDVRAIAAHSDSVSADLLNAPPGMASLPTWSALLVRVVLRDPTPGGTRVRLESRWHNPLRTGAGRTQWTTQIARAPRAAGSSGLVVPVLVHGSQCTVTLRARIEGQPLARAVEHVVTLGTCGE